MTQRYTVAIYYLAEQHFATFREAVDAYELGARLGHVMPFGHAPIDEGDTGLTELEQTAIEMTDCEGRDALLAMIDGISGRAA